MPPAEATPARRRSRKIRSAGTHLRAIVNDILDLSKIEAGKMGLYLTEFDLPLVVRDAADAVRPQIAGRPVSLTAECEASVGVMLGDSTKVRQIVLNILGNAVKFTKEGEVRLTASRVQREDGDWFRISVSDTGIGMSSEQAQSVFAAFTRPTPLRPCLWGTGWGSPFRGACAAHGRRHHGVQRTGKGSEFVIMLPARAEKTNAN